MAILTASWTMLFAFTVVTLPVAAIVRPPFFTGITLALPIRARQVTEYLPVGSSASLHSATPQSDCLLACGTSALLALLPRLPDRLESLQQKHSRSDLIRPQT